MKNSALIILAIESVLIPSICIVIGYWVIQRFALHPAWWIVPVVMAIASAWVLIREVQRRLQ
ncbi:MAG: hypothetical protein KDD46_06300 [Bdellovibrionales bacterium]|nr:hypothetical protein [Bdellovibrionales bacterium]